MGAMTRPLEEVIELMTSAVKTVVSGEFETGVSDDFGMSDISTMAGNITATFVDDGIMVRAYTEDSGTTVEVAGYTFKGSWAVSLEGSDMPDEVEDSSEEVGMEYLGTLPAGGEEKPLPVSETDDLNVPEEGCGCGCHQNES